MNRLEQKEMKKKILIQTTWYNWLINHVVETIRKTVGVFKNTVESLFKTKTPED